MLANGSPRPLNCFLWEVEEEEEEEEKIDKNGVINVLHTVMFLV